MQPELERGEHVHASAGGIPPLSALLASSSVRVQENAAAALATLSSLNSENRVRIASAGGVPRLIALLVSPAVAVVQYAAVALGNVGANAENRAKIASAGGIPRLVALLASPSASVREAASRTLRSLGCNSHEMGWLRTRIESGCPYLSFPVHRAHLRALRYRACIRACAHTSSAPRMPHWLRAQAPAVLRVGP